MPFMGWAAELLEPCIRHLPQIGGADHCRYWHPIPRFLPPPSDIPRNNTLHLPRFCVYRGDYLGMLCRVRFVVGGREKLA